MINSDLFNKYQKYFISVAYLGLMTVFYLIFYPGSMMKDSVVQLSQAIDGQYSNWHPPIMAFVWNNLLYTPFKIGGMLFFHLAMLWGGSLLLYLWSSKNRYKYSFLFLFIPLLPWVINFEFSLMKDVGLAYSWLMCISLSLNYDRNKKYSFIIIFLIVIFFSYGFLVRSNAAAGAVFLFPFLFATLLKKTSIKHLVFCFVSVLFLQFTLPSLTNSALSVKDSKPLTYLMMDDVVALKIMGLGEDYSVFSESEIAEMESCKLLQTNKTGAGLCDIPKMKDLSKNYYDELKEEWITIIIENPKEYLFYRFGAFINFVGTPSFNKPYYASEFLMLEAPYYIENEKHFFELSIAPIKELTPIQELISYYPRVFPHIPLLRELFKPYLWLSLAMITCFFLYRKKEQNVPPFWMLPASGISYMSGYILFTQAQDFRYAYWLCLITTLSLIILFILQKCVSNNKPT